MNMTGKGYLCSAGETFDSVALTLFDDSRYTADLMCANPSLCGKMVFSGGEIMELPDIDTESGNHGAEESAPWRR